jgi:hypothetical protein
MVCYPSRGFALAKWFANTPCQRVLSYALRRIAQLIVQSQIYLAPAVEAGYIVTKEMEIK